VKLVALAVLLALAAPVHAGGRKQVAILEFGGPRAASVRGEVVRLAAASSYVSSVSKLDGRTVRELALDLELDVVVLGDVEQRGREYHLRLRYVRGSTGRTILETTATLREPVLDPETRKRVERDLRRALRAAR
jgi:hypothetical protein